MGKFSGAGQSGLVGHLCFERIGCKCVMLNLGEKRKTVQVQLHKKHKGQQEYVWCTRVKCQFTLMQIMKGHADQNQIWMSQWLVNALCVFILGFSQEYSPELQAISKRGKSSVTTGEGGITITSIRHSREDSYGSYNADQPPSYSTTQRNSTAISSSTAAPGTGNRCVCIKHSLWLSLIITVLFMNVSVGMCRYSIQPILYKWAVLFPLPPWYKFALSQPAVTIVSVLCCCCFLVIVVQ